MSMFRRGLFLALGLVAGFTGQPQWGYAQEATTVAVPPASPAGEIAAAESVQTRRPLLVIRFNQKNVYFRSALTQAVQKAESAKPGIVYSVISYQPAGKDDNFVKMDQTSAANLRAVVDTMTSLGVASSRIQVNTQPMAKATTQEIHIFVY